MSEIYTHREEKSGCEDLGKFLMKRQRGRNRRNNNQNANRSMESNGPDVKVRGSAKQIFDKYEALARDAAASGNRVKAENLRQHAEHYLRIVNAIELAKQAVREEQEAAQEAAGESGSDDDEDSVDGKSSDNRKGRRYPPRARRKDEPTAEKSESETQEDADSGQQAETVSDEKPAARRRKAPARKPAEANEAEEIVSEAAE